MLQLGKDEIIQKNERPSCGHLHSEEFGTAALRAGPQQVNTVNAATMFTT